MCLKDSVSFTVAGLTVKLSFDELPEITEAFVPFLSGLEPDYTVCFNKVKSIPDFPQKAVYRDNGYLVAKSDNGFIRCFFDGAHNNLPYAVGFYDWENRLIDINYLECGAKAFSQTGNSFHHIAWEKLLMREGRFMLHAACVDTPFGGILFSGPSGIGKSTQGALWCSYGGGRLINGDRPVIAPCEGGFKAFGSPYAGSSRCYVNDSCDIKAVVFLSRSPECKISELKGYSAFKSLFSGLTVNSWDEEFVSAACDTAEKMAEGIPMFSFGCTPDKNAVEVLEKALRGGI